MKYNDLLAELSITDISSEGKGVARYKDLVVFIENAIPGDVVDAKVIRKKKNYIDAFLDKVIIASPYRQEAYCSHFYTCGGCSWQHMSYEAQLKFKHQQIEETVKRLSQITLPPFFPILAAPQDRYYRNKLDFSFSNKRWLYDDDMEIIGDEKRIKENINHNALGFHIPGRFDKVLDIKHCYHQPDPSNAIRLTVRDFALENNISFCDLKKQEGQLRSMIIRNTSTNEWMVMLMVREYDDKIEALLNHLLKQIPQITSLQYVINTKRNDQYSDLDFTVFAGKDHIVEKMEDLIFKIGPKSFYQTNSAQAYHLYKVARDFAAIEQQDTVYDLYTGTGTIALFVAKQAHKVVGIEYVPAAIDDAKLNASVNNISNTGFFAGDMKDVLNDTFVATHGKPQVIITDPPRAGMHADVVQKIIEIAPQKVVYVSCNPATQARDIQLMDAHYSVSKAQPVDMFPQTTHTENVLLLERR